MHFSTIIYIFISCFAVFPSSIEGGIGFSSILGVDKAVEKFTGKIIAIIHRLDDAEDKWVVCPENKTFSKEEIAQQVRFQEQFFKTEIIL